jgi:hypothetical protein
MCFLFYTAPPRIRADPFDLVAWIVEYRVVPGFRAVAIPVM